MKVLNRLAVMALMLGMLFAGNLSAADRADRVINPQSAVVMSDFIKSDYFIGWRHGKKRYCSTRYKCCKHWGYNYGNRYCAKWGYCYKNCYYKRHYKPKHYHYRPKHSYGY